MTSFAIVSTFAREVDYSQGVIFINEDWYGHQNSTINYLLPDDPDGDYWHYRVIQSENPGTELGCTNQYGAIWNGRLYLIAKQEKDPGASIVGGRISVADAATMKIIKQLPLIDPSGNQCDGRAFCGVTATKGYVSTSNGIWILDLETLEIVGQVKGSENPNVEDGNELPNTNPSASLYYGQTGTMVLAEGKVFAVHQQYGLLVIDPESDRVTELLDMSIVDNAIEQATGTRPARPSGIGSTIVRAKDGSLWHSVARNVQGSGDTMPYVVRIDPMTLEREVVRIEGNGVYPPSNSWYAWTPDPFCASQVTNRLYWCGGPNSWFTTDRVFRFDIDTRKVEKILDFADEPGDWHIYGCSLGIHPQTDELYASVFHKFIDPTYATRRYDADGRLLMEYPMISNYWFPSLPVFPQNAENEQDCTDILSPVCEGILVGDNAPLEVYTMGGRRVSPENLPSGIYVVKRGSLVRKLVIK